MHSYHANELNLTKLGVRIAVERGQEGGGRACATVPLNGRAPGAALAIAPKLSAHEQQLHRQCHEPADRGCNPGGLHAAQTLLRERAAPSGWLPAAQQKSIGSF